LGHYDIWLINRLQEISVALGSGITGNRFTSIGTRGFSWMNGNLYQPANEHFAIAPISPELRDQYGMLPFNQATTKLNSRTQHYFLAEKHNTRLPILPVHSPAERSYFTTLMIDPTLFTSKSANPKFNDMAHRWNQAALDKPQLNYKVCMQMQMIN
jgi:hypothetical protein